MQFVERGGQVGEKDFKVLFQSVKALLVALIDIFKDGFMRDKLIGPEQCAEDDETKKKQETDEF
jgi:hypothetical protein